MIARGQLIWEEGDNVPFDSTVMFGKGYNFEGLTHCAQSAKGLKGNYLMWPKGIRKESYSLYRDTDGMIAFEKYPDEESCKKAAEEWDRD